jgi:hypothetical protein
MFAATSGHSLHSDPKDIIGQIVLKHSRAHVIQSKGDGFGSYIERLVNVAHETHRSFSSFINTLNDLIDYIRNELERSYQHHQFSIIIGKDFDYDEILTDYFALIEHTGMKILIFSCIGCSYKLITTTTDDINDDTKPLSW